VIDDEGLVDNARVVGEAMLRELRAFVEDYPFVGEVRGRGLFLAIEMVRDEKTREPLASAVAKRIYDACVQRGLIVMAYAPRIRLQPALTLDLETAQNALAILREVFDVVKAEAWWRTP
jgi:4-aminobutyrate aminotransferase / (S)-3-amino-2-methylpropionate transaminase / 5-aminovalerate transaminase